MRLKFYVRVIMAAENPLFSTYVKSDRLSATLPQVERKNGRAG